MNEKEFTNLCKNELIKYINEHLDKSDLASGTVKPVTLDDLYIVWEVKVLENNKAMLSATLPDGMYYELTYNGSKKELYLDAYKKWDNKCIKISD